MNRIFRLDILTILFISLFITISLNATELPQVEILGLKFYVYETKKGDTFFNIATSQNWDDRELQRLNPDAASPFKKGTKLYYPVNETSLESITPQSLKSASIRELTHIVGKGETVYSISQLYSIPLETIYSLNPSSKRGIKIGDTLILRAASDTIMGIGDDQEINTEESKGKRNYYIVGNDETLRKVANDNEISVQSIFEANPGVSQSTFKEGEKIILPEKGTGIETSIVTREQSRFDHFEEYQVMENDTWSGISDKYGITVEQLQAINPSVRVLKKNQIISVPKLETYQVNETVKQEDPRQTTYWGVNEIYNDVHKVADSEDKRIIKYAIVTDSPSARKDMEFIRGFLTGVDELKKEPYKIELKVIDGSRSAEEVITELDGFNPTLVFVTADKNIPSYISEYASISQTPVVNTFDVKNEEFTTNPYFIQLMAPSNYFNDCVASSAREKYEGFKLVLVGEEDVNDLLAQSLKKLWQPEDIKYLPTGEFEAFKVNPFDKILIYGFYTKKDEVGNLLKEIKDIRMNNLTADVFVLGRPNWIVFSENMNEDFQNAYVSVPSRFYVDYNSLDYQRFLAGYKDLFKRNPVKSVPLYAAVGYDNAIYFTKALEKSSLDFNKLQSSRNSIQTQFDLKRLSNWSGFVNLPVYLINFTPNSEAELIVIE